MVYWGELPFSLTKFCHSTLKSKYRYIVTDNNKWTTIVSASNFRIISCPETYSEKHFLEIQIEFN